MSNDMFARIIIWLVFRVPPIFIISYGTYRDFNSYSLTAFVCLTLTIIMHIHDTIKEQQK